MSFAEAGMYSGLGQGLSQVGSNLIQFSLEDARRQQQENLARLQMQRIEKMWDKKVAHDNEVREVAKLEQIVGYDQSGMPVTRGQIEGGSFQGDLYASANVRMTPRAVESSETDKMKDYAFLTTMGVDQQDALNRVYKLGGGGGGGDVVDNGDLEKAMKITQTVLGDNWKEGDQIPASKLQTINLARKNAGLQPLVESSERDANWLLPKFMEGKKYTYSDEASSQQVQAPPAMPQAAPLQREQMQLPSEETPQIPSLPPISDRIPGQIYVAPNGMVIKWDGKGAIRVR